MRMAQKINMKNSHRRARIISQRQNSQTRASFENHLTIVLTF
jgi:hypothetical protein